MMTETIFARFPDSLCKLWAILEVPLACLDILMRCRCLFVFHASFAIDWGSKLHLLLFQKVGDI
jgi:hypothetical protein